MDTFPKPDQVPPLDSYSIKVTFLLDALATLTHDQPMAMLTNYYNNNNQSGKCKVLHRKDLGALILIIYDIIKELRDDKPDEYTPNMEKSKKTTYCREIHQ